MTEINLLIVDDEPHYRQLLSDRLGRKGWTTFTAGNAEEALAIAESVGIDAALVDILMGGMDGLELLERLKAIDPGIEAIILTGHANIDTAIRAMKLGAFDYLSKPYKLSELDILLERALDRRRLYRRCASLAAQVEHLRGRDAEQMVGESRAWLSAVNLARKAAAQNLPILISGESGSGKEVVAAAVHRWSPRASATYVPINCGALPEHLLESELFGHRRGAFTGAMTDKEGLFHVASTGTLFLDEIGELPLAGQAKLLRVLETGEYRPLGQTALRRTEARIVAATNRNLEAEVKAGRFREDLLYRLNVVNVAVPPLRQRASDIPLLVAHFMARSQAPTCEIESGAMARLMDYSWPGNVRELRNVVERLLMLADGPTISEAMVAGLVAGRDQGVRVGTGKGLRLDRILPLDDLERTYVRWALALCDNNISTAARKLKISRSTLYRYIDGLVPEE